jgi:hypothetical protein
MAYTDVMICNMALLAIGDKTISLLSEGTRRADVCNVNYQPAVDVVLQKYEWTFATRRATLSLEDEEPEYEYSYQYILPSSPYCLAVQKVYPESEYQIEGRRLLSNQSSLKIKYTARVEDESDFSPSFARACADYLAYLIVFPLSGDKQRTDEMLGRFRISFRSAVLDDARQKYNSDADDESEHWINSRDG